MKGTMSTKTKITIAITAAVAVAVIVALKYFNGKSNSSNALPANRRTAGAGSLGSDIPISTPQAITEGAYNQDPNEMGDAIDSPSSEDTGVLILS